MINWDRFLLPVYVVWCLTYASIWPVLVVMDGQASLTVARYGVSFSFFVGASLTLFGLGRYIRSFDRTIPAYLGLLFVKSVTFWFMGLAFLVLAVGGAPPQTPLPVAIVVFYYIVGLTAASKLFTGTYTLIGVGRGWINREVQINPFSADMRKR